METGEPAKTKFVVGLGNPGRRYASTRHNVGFMVLNRLAERWQADPGRKAFGGTVVEARPARQDQGHMKKVLLLAPETYMNLSGRAVREMVSFYKAALAEVLVVLDDTALPLGRLRARLSGSAGGHNGLADVLEALGSQDVPRLRIGIGAAPGMMDTRDYVLAKFTAEQENAIVPAIDQAAEAVEHWVFEGMTYVMERYNRKPENQDAGT